MKLKALVLAAVMTLGMASTAFAGWRTGALRTTDWWYETDGKGGYLADCWAWIDGNGDGIAECYYFDKDGWMLTSQESPDHWVTNAGGCWTLEGVVQTRTVAPGSVTVCGK